MIWKDKTAQEVARMALPLSIGQSRIGPLWVDLTRVPHLLVGGTTLYGKTAWIRQAVTGLVLLRKPEQLCLLLMDFKRTEFTVFAGLPHLSAPVINELSEAVAWITKLNAEMDRRLALFETSRVNEIVAYNAKADEYLPYVLVVVDEFAELRSADGPEKDEQAARKGVLARIQRLGRLGRAAGIHLILATQRPDAETVAGQIKGQCSGRVAFYCADNTMSEIALDNKAAASLPPLEGRGIWRWDRQIQFQSPWLSPEDCAELLDKAYPERRAQPEEQEEEVKAA
jgi:DNA segregation ATPase FtsK/SpoIIIE, S-DNA-T family